MLDAYADEMFFGGEYVNGVHGTTDFHKILASPIGEPLKRIPDLSSLTTSSTSPIEQGCKDLGEIKRTRPSFYRTDKETTAV